MWSLFKNISIYTVEFVIPLCDWGEFQEATIVVKRDGIYVMGRAGDEFREMSIDVEGVYPALAPYVKLYDALASSIAKVLDLTYESSGDIYTWLRRHVEFIDAASAKFGKLIDKVGLFTVRRHVKTLYIPYSGHTLTLTYVAYPYRDALVTAENKGRVMAIGSVIIEWGGVKVASAGVRTLAGALLLAQAAPELMPQLQQFKNTLEEFVNKFRSISQCQ